MKIQYNKPDFKVNFFDSESVMTDSSVVQDGLTEATFQKGSQAWNGEWDQMLIR